MSKKPWEPERPVAACLVDTHLHLTDAALAAVRGEVLVRAREAGVVQVIDQAIDLATAHEALRRAREVDGRWPRVAVAVGIHPHEARKAPDDVMAQLTALARAPEVVAVGEVGLDYHYDLSPRPVQRALLERQLQMALELDLPVVLHEREAGDDLLSILDALPRPPAGVIHSFSEGPELAEEFLARGLHLGFGGMLTFASADGVRQAARLVPLERILFETDAPYLAPHPRRGRRNEPALIGWTVATMALLRQSDSEEMACQAAQNAARLFRLRPPESEVGSAT